MDLNELSLKRRVRALIVGYPGSGKTGALAALANAGFRLRILDFDGNIEPLLTYVLPENYGNVEVVSLEDKMELTPAGFEARGVPEAFSRAVKLMDHWKYTTPGGREVDLGPVKTWSQRDVLVVDSLTGLGRAAFRRVLKVNNRGANKVRIKDWGLGASDVDAFVEKATSELLSCNVVFTAHLKIIGPEKEEEDDSDLTKQLKERMAEIVPTKRFPIALGRELPQHIAEHFPVMLLAEGETVNGKVKRVIRTVPSPDLDVKVPVELKGLPESLPLSDGLLTIFNKLLDPAGAAVSEAA